MSKSRKPNTGKHFSNAHALLEEAFNQLPEPRLQWNAAGWILLALGENAARSESFPEVIRYLQEAVYAPGTIGNPWLHLRFGQAQLEVNDQQRALNELMRAYLGAGKEIFSALDPKYFRFLQSKAQPPHGGW
ncbi:MAG: tetratricopeptide repeat protein [Pleurocapsa sp. SU_196_0]|nr:tetratricopeptide repeat protein [Pleurocapsa sp. SU_196_0]